MSPEGACASKKRAAECQETHCDTEDGSPKRSKLNKKEMLEQAKARLREAQEKKLLLQQRLEEEKKKETEIQEPLSESFEQGYEEYDYDYCEDYYYEYHIPPVTGPRENLLIMDIASTGPAEKVHFIEDSKSCIEEVLKVINARKRSLSPMNPDGPWVPQLANPQGPPAGPAPVSVPNRSETNENQNHKVPVQPLINGEHHPPPIPPPPPKPHHPNYQNHSKPNLREREGEREWPRDRDGQTNEKPRRDFPNEKPPSDITYPVPISLQRRDLAGTQPNRSHRDSSGPPLKPTTRPWKLALVQITSKALDCTLDLPTKTPYMIRTQEQGVVAYVQFFSVPDNPSLLQHNPPSKRHLQDHLVPLHRLPCHTGYAWNSHDILAFLQNQDERRTTYLPPARRNLPLSHWALLDLEQPLHQAIDSQGYFTASLCEKNTANNNGNGNRKEISFAGKLVWNMNDFYHNQESGLRQKNAAKLSKWGEMVSVRATTAVRNAPLIATIQGFYEIPLDSTAAMTSMPPALRARKVILPKSRTIGIIIGANRQMNEAALEQRSSWTVNNSAVAVLPQAAIVGCVQVLFPNGMAGGPSSFQSLRGARAILYD